MASVLLGKRQSLSHNSAPDPCLVLYRLLIASPTRACLPVCLTRYLGKGVTKAVENINTIIAPAIKVRARCHGRARSGVGIAGRHERVARMFINYLHRFSRLGLRYVSQPTEDSAGAPGAFDARYTVSERSRGGAVVFFVVQGMSPIDQAAIDNKMKEIDGTDNKGKLGANALLAVSMAVAKVLCVYKSVSRLGYSAMLTNVWCN